jgi:hypothetical protein
MDDKLFEEKMQNLKNSYEHISTISSPEKIINVVKKNEKPHKIRIFFQLPYVASFIGVLLIGGILGAQFLTNSKDGTSGESTKPKEEIINHPVTDENIEAAINETRGYYERKLDELKEKLDFEDVEQYGFVQEAKNAVEKFEERENYASQEELTSYMEKVKGIISYRVSMPQEEFALLQETAANDETIRADQLYDYLDKLDMLHELFYEKWAQLYLENQSTVTDIESYVDELNAGTIVTDNQEYSELIKALHSYGYAFFHEGEGSINFGPDYLTIHNQLHSLDEDAKVYLKIKSEKKALLDGALSISHKNLGERLLEIENFVLNNPTSSKGEELKEQYALYLNFYLKGTNNTLITTEDGKIKAEVKAEFESLLNEKKFSETAKIVKDFYQKLEGAQFYYTDEIVKTKIEVSGELKPKSDVYAIQTNLLPITKAMVTRYEMFKESGDLAIYTQPYAGMNTIEMALARIYMYAIEKGDYETAYKLSTDGENGKLPELEVFQIEMKESAFDFQALSNKVTKVSTNYLQDGEVIEHIFMIENGDMVTFRMKLENGYPKIEYKPL